MYCVHFFAAVVLGQEARDKATNINDDVIAATDVEGVSATTEEPTTTTTLPPVLRVHPHDLMLIHREEHVLGVIWDTPEDYKNETLTYDVFYVEGNKDCECFPSSPSSLTRCSTTTVVLVRLHCTFGSRCCDRLE